MTTHVDRYHGATRQAFVRTNVRMNIGYIQHQWGSYGDSAPLFLIEMHVENLVSDSIMVDWQTYAVAFL
jgi:hypothetical protein